jgi:putative acetyltransferase
VNGCVIIRPATPADAKGILEALRAAVLETAASAYAPDVLTAWAPNVTPDAVQRMAETIGGEAELVVVAESGKMIAGFGSIVPADAELRAIYVHPAFGRRGVGARLLEAVEHLAMRYQLRELVMDASLNAEHFYAKHGFDVVGRGEHVLSTGARMPSVKMRKPLEPA